MILELIQEAREAGARLGPCCEVVELDVRTVQRWLKHGPHGGEDSRNGPLRTPKNKLSPEEREDVLKLVNSPEFADLAPHQIVPKLADMGMYVASESTIYRLLREAKLNTHRGRARPPTRRHRPQEYAATGPNQVWCWDITYLRSPVRGEYYYLYLFLDVWSRKIVGWDVFDRECNEVAATLFLQICTENNIDPDGLVLHSDNGGPMKGATMLATLEKLGVVKSFSRPRVSDDNPYVESIFRTCKYRPGFPGVFESLDAAQAWVVDFVAWYNTEHQHSAIRFVTPQDRHEGRDVAILAQRKALYERAKATHPERWTRDTRNWTPIHTVKLNPRRDGTTKIPETQSPAA